eukprot:TRINITY_DN15828_c0_g1_i1.p1 TRINITY_DN15828_c0_g1~~TRINITY_DN15828_c0_g1_i1.p1  ORF type:complete len:366 (+),score=81.93 TRINITY_DN15828_c0_g1_i1:69-1100(+)
MAVASNAAFALPNIGVSPALRAHAGRLAAAQEMPKDVSDARLSSGSSGLMASALAVAGAVAAAAGLRRSQRAQRRGVTCKASYSSGFCSSGSGFYGAPVATAFGGIVQCEPAVEDCAAGVAGLGMRNQQWVVTHKGFDGHKGKIFDSRRRESRRRGEELFRHDVDNFELTTKNLVEAPGAARKKIMRGRGKYGSHGRSCGYGYRGVRAKRGRRTVNPGHSGHGWALHKKTPKLGKALYDSMKPEPYTLVSTHVLDMCEDNDEVDFDEMVVRGLPVKRDYRWDRVKIVDEEKTEFSTKNLTVFAHAFQPSAREKIEDLGGRCIRLHPVANIPIDESYQPAKATA